MASKEVGKLTGRQIVRLVNSVDINSMKRIASRYMSISKEIIDDMEQDARGNWRSFNREVIRRWTKQNPVNQMKVRPTLWNTFTV